MDRIDPTALRRDMNQFPENIDAIRAQANVFMRAEHYGTAFHLYKSAAMLTEFRDVRVLRDLALSELLLASTAGTDEWIECAREALERAVALAPDDPEVLTAYGGTLLQLGMVQTAEEYLRRSLELADRKDTHFGLATALLFREEFGEAWDHLEHHVGEAQRWIQSDPAAPYWNGEPTEHLLVIGEQGLGDEISFASMVPDVLNDPRVGRVTLYCDPRLKNLFKATFGDALDVHGYRKTASLSLGKEVRVDSGYTVDFNDYSARCLSGSLAVHYRRSADSFPRTGFLTPEASQVARWRNILAQHPGKKVGIAFTGGKPPSYWHRRGLPAPDLLRLLSVPGITWVSLQYEPIEEEALRYLHEHGITLWAPHLSESDYQDTVALVAALDDVVTVTTSIAHVCGALGKVAHVLVPRITRPFYGTWSDRSAWYESLRLHRQTDKGWPIDEVREAIAP